VIQLSALLSCWASSRDIKNQSACLATAKELEECMARSVRFFARPSPEIETFPQGNLAKPKKSSINYHLARLGQGRR
jgi:hypothetical protein